MNGRLSILGLYRADKTIFDNMVLPDASFSQEYDGLYITPLPIEKDVLIFSILSELSQFSAVYTDPEFMKEAIHAWSVRKLWSWQKLYESFFYKYNPIWNKDGKITHSDLETRDLSTSGSGTGAITRERNIERDTTGTTTGSNEETTTGTTEESGTSQNGNTNTRSVTSYNDDTLKQAEQIVDSGTGSSSGTSETSTTTEGSADTTSTGRETGTETETESRTDGRTGTDTGTVKHEYEAYERGNIGVTMTQDMIEKDRELYRNNIYDIIIKDFKEQFCIMIY